MKKRGKVWSHLLLVSLFFTEKKSEIEEEFISFNRKK